MAPTAAPTATAAATPNAADLSNEKAKEVERQRLARIEKARCAAYTAKMFRNKEDKRRAFAGIQFKKCGAGAAYRAWVAAGLL